MSAQSLIASSQYPNIKTGIIVTNVSQVTNVTFNTPFPVGSLPLIFLQNAEGAVWQNIIFTTQGLTNTGFQIVQNNLENAGTYEEVGLSWIAIWIAATPPPP